MKILLVGDVFARFGRKTIAQLLPDLKKDKQIDFVIVNGENLHHGKGFSDAMIQELQAYGVDFFTGGNHIWKLPETIENLQKPDYPFVRPANYPPGTPGRGYAVVNTFSPAGKIAVINLMGRVFMTCHLDDPFRVADNILSELEHDGLSLGNGLSAITVDFHAETASEKMALAQYLDGRVTVVYGTHTHVQTADEQILPKNTAYITDLGMTGVIDSIIGVEKNIIIDGFLTQRPVRHQIASGKTRFGGLFLETDDKTGMAVKIERLQIFPIDVSLS